MSDIADEPTIEGRITNLEDIIFLQGKIYSENISRLEDRIKDLEQLIKENK